MKTTAIALALALSLATGAQAATFSTTSEGIVGDGSYFQMGDSQLKGYFKDTYEFAMTATNEINPIASFNVTGKSSINNFTMSLYDNGTLIDKYTGNNASIDLTSGAGEYSLQLTGEGTGKNGGSYSGSVAISAVPEPTESALILSGIAMIGFIASRRSKKTA